MILNFGDHMTTGISTWYGHQPKEMNEKSLRKINWSATFFKLKCRTFNVWDVYDIYFYVVSWIFYWKYIWGNFRMFKPCDKARKRKKNTWCFFLNSLLHNFDNFIFRNFLLFFGRKDTLCTKNIIPLSVFIWILKSKETLKFVKKTDSINSIF